MHRSTRVRIPTSGDTDNLVETAFPVQGPSYSGALRVSSVVSLVWFSTAFILQMALEGVLYLRATLESALHSPLLRV